MIRPAQETDAAAMAEVLSDWIDATPWMPRIHTRAGDFGFCQGLIRRMDVWIADRPEGVGFLARDGDSIDAFYLAPEIRRNGWGTALLAAAMAGRKTLKLWTFQANHAAIAFYQTRGFRIAEVTEGQGNEEKIPDCLMTWERPS